MTVLINSAEGGSDETTVSAGNSGGASGNAFDSDILNATFDTARAAHGSLSIRTGTSANTASYVSWATTSSPWYGRVAFYMTALPPANMQVLQFMSGATARLYVRVMTGGTVQITSSAFADLGTSSTTLSTGQWNAIEFLGTAGGPAANLAQVLIYTSASFRSPVETINSSSTTISSWDRIRFGANFSASQTYDLWVDDLGLSDVGYLSTYGMFAPPPPNPVAVRRPLLVR